MKRIIILGAGSGGVMTANRLRKEFRRSSLEILVIEKKSDHLYQPGLTLLPFNLEKAENLVRPLKGLLAPGIKLLTDEVLTVDPDHGRVLTAHFGEVRYDQLVICTGCQPDPTAISGLDHSLKRATTVFSFYNLTGALALREAMKNFAGGTLISSMCTLPITCPTAPLSFILLADDLLRSQRLRHKCELIFTTPASTLFPAEPFGSALAHIFAERDIKMMLNFTPTVIDGDAMVVESQQGEKISFDLASICPPHLGAPVMRGCPALADGAGWVKSDKQRLSLSDYDNIFCLGDASDFPLAKTASGARKQAEVVVARLKAKMNKQEATASYDGETICPILTRHGKAMFAHLNYHQSLGTATESSLYWNVTVNMLRPLYFNLMLPGLM